jgi:hypothetical protein
MTDQQLQTGRALATQLLALFGPPPGSDPKVLKANAVLLQDAGSVTVDELEAGIGRYADAGEVGMLLRTIAEFSDDIDVSNDGTVMGLPLWEPDGPFSKTGSANKNGLQSWIDGIHANDPNGEFQGKQSPTSRKAYVELSKKSPDGQRMIWVNAKTGVLSPFV